MSHFSFLLRNVMVFCFFLCFRLYHCKLNILLSVCWFDKTKHLKTLSSGKVWHFFIIFWPYVDQATNWLIEKITGRIDYVKNYYLLHCLTGTKKIWGLWRTWTSTMPRKSFSFPNSILLLVLPLLNYNPDSTLWTLCNTV